jgi:hypothetical protein
VIWITGNTNPGETVTSLLAAQLGGGRQESPVTVYERVMPGARITLK